MHPLRLGIVGCGGVAEEIHIPNLLAIAECRVVAIADINPERLQHIGEKFNIPQPDRYENPEQIYSRSDVDAVLILTPSNTHKELVIQAAEAGKHVFVEKPMALDGNECQMMVNTVRKSNVRLAVGHYYGFLPTHQRLRRMMRRGDIGRVIGAQVHAETMLIKPGEGQLLDFAPHFVDLLRWYFDDSYVQTVFATTSKIAGGENTAETEATLILKFASGVTGTINLFWIPDWQNWDVGERFVRIVGTRGTLKSGLTSATMTVYKSSRLVNRIRGAYEIVPRFVSHPVMPITGTSFRKELEDFISAVQNDRVPSVSGEVGMEVMRIVDAARKSSQTGQAVEVV